jgi:hypothetical protein
VFDPQPLALIYPRTFSAVVFVQESRTLPLIALGFLNSNKNDKIAF